MRKILVVTLILGSILGILSASSQPALAQSQSGSVIDLKGLKIDDIVLRGPYETYRIRFGLPADWKLEEGVEIQLDFSTFYGGIGLLNQDGLTDHSLGGALEVSFNGELVDIVLIVEPGDRSVTISIPADALESVRDDGQVELRFFLDAALDCEFDHQTMVVIQDTTRIVLKHGTQPLEVDLTKLPRPIFQETFVEESAVLVIPDKPSAGELQAALAVAAGFGEMTGSDLLMSYMQASELTNQVLESSHLIFVGMPDAFPSLGTVSLPAPVSGSNFNAAGGMPDDGIIQMAVSPWNDAKAILVVGGNTEEAVIKAGQAISTGIIRVGAEPDLALVEKVQPEEFASYTGVDRSLANLGHEDFSVNYFGFSTFEFDFYISPGFTLGPDAYFDLLFTHSTLLDYETSGLVVEINDQPIGSARLDADSTNNGEVRIRIPTTVIRTGRNQVRIDVNLVPTTICLDPRLAYLWIRIDSASLLHLPLIPKAGSIVPFYDLGQYPEPFSFDAIMSSVAFVLAPDDSNGWFTALQVAFDLGDRTGISLANLAAVYADAIPEEIRQTRDLIIVGRPSALPILMELSDKLPAPFESGSDQAIERNLQVSYRLLPDVSIGYLELISSPWNSERSVLAVLGSTNQGLQFAADALTVPDLRGSLAGNFAVINREQVVTTDTRNFSAVESALVRAAPGAGEQISEIEQPGVSTESQFNRPAWILPLLIGIVLLILVVLLVVLLKTIRKR